MAQSDHPPGSFAKSERPPARRPRAAWIWRWIGWALFGLGLIGLAVPVMPTTIFWILAVLALREADPRLTERILSWPRVGPAIANFIDHGAISSAGKTAALGGLGLGGVVASLSLGAGWPLWVCLSVLIGVAAYILTRPEPPAA